MLQSPLPIRPPGGLLRQFTLTARSAESGPFRLQPLFAQSGNLSDGIATGPDDAAVRVEVEPLTPGARYFAMVNITSNETQQITIVSPQ